MPKSNDQNIKEQSSDRSCSRARSAISLVKRLVSRRSTSRTQLSIHRNGWRRVSLSRGLSLGTPRLLSNSEKMPICYTSRKSSSKIRDLIWKCMTRLDQWQDKGPATLGTIPQFSLGTMMLIRSHIAALWNGQAVVTGTHSWSLRIVHQLDLLLRCSHFETRTILIRVILSPVLTSTHRRLLGSRSMDISGIQETSISRTWRCYAKMKDTMITTISKC